MSRVLLRSCICKASEGISQQEKFIISGVWLPVVAYADNFWVLGWNVHACAGFARGLVDEFLSVGWVLGAGAELATNGPDEEGPTRVALGGEMVAERVPRAKGLAVLGSRVYLATEHALDSSHIAQAAWGQVSKNALFTKAAGKGRAARLGAVSVVDACARSAALWAVGARILLPKDMKSLDVLQRRVVVAVLRIPRPEGESSVDYARRRWRRVGEVIRELALPRWGASAACELLRVEEKWHWTGTRKACVRRVRCAGTARK